jgi:hypothetical protein
MGPGLQRRGRKRAAAQLAAGFYAEFPVDVGKVVRVWIRWRDVTQPLG